MKTAPLAAALSIIVLAACGSGNSPDAGDPQAEPAMADAGSEGSGCTNDQPALPGTGLCQGTALEMLGFPDGAPDMPVPDTGCAWVPGEAPIGPDYLLYLALSCEGTTSQANVAIGAQRAELTVEPSAIRAKWGSEDEVIDENTLPRAAIYTMLDGQSAEASILGRAELAAQQDGASFEGCEVLPLYEGSDAVIVSLPLDEMPMEGPPMFCGPLGVRDGSVQFWRALSSDYIMYVETGGDIIQDVDFTTMTMLVSDGNGSWKKAPRPRPD